MARINVISGTTHDGRQFAIKVTRLSHESLKYKSLKQRSTYTLIVPYHRLSKTIQQIQLLGDKIIDIKVHFSALALPEANSLPTKLIEIPSEVKETKLEPTSETITAEITKKEVIISTEELGTIPSAIASQIVSAVEKKITSRKRTSRLNKPAQRLRGASIRRKSKYRLS